MQEEVNLEIPCEENKEFTVKNCSYRFVPGFGKMVGGFDRSMPNLVTFAA